MTGSTIAILVSDQSIDLDLWNSLYEKHRYHIALFQELKPFVQFCCEDQPNLIAVSLHHPYEKIKSLPLGLRNVLKTPIVCFAEREDPNLESEFSKHPKEQIVDVILDELAFMEVFSSLLADPKTLTNEKKSSNEISYLIEQIYSFVGEKEGFGKIKIADQNEIIKEQRSRRATQIKADQKLKEGLLIEACQITLKKLLDSKPLEKSSDFKTETSFVTLVEMENYKGFLTYACKQEHSCRLSVAQDIATQMQFLLQDWGLTIEMGEVYSIHSPTLNFVKSYSEFSEFIVHHKDEGQNEWALSFIKREAVQPSYVLSEDNKMLKMDIKTIPPLTVLPFDGYIYLPKNNKYVKYLKEGSSISLEQVKRHSKDVEKSHIYVPIESKNKVIKFYIQNTINWELALENQNEVA